ncbi:MAG: hypothetical protein ACJAYU_002008 [Bradymonadia bacterium]|jgi:hypothetical protein
MKVGEEKALPVVDVREQLAGMLKWIRISRHDRHMARHGTPSETPSTCSS